MKHKALSAVTLLAACALAHAELSPQIAGEARYLCGGIGQGEQQAMEAQAGQYDLMLTFATSSGAYIADVDVSIADARGNVLLATRCGGPLMLVGLPRKSAYKITATSNGEARQRTLSAGGRAVFTWPAQP